MARQEPAELEDEAEATSAEIGERVRPERSEVDAVHRDGPLRRPAEPAEHGEERGLAGPGATTDGNQLTSLDLEIEPVHCRDRTTWGRVRLPKRTGVDEHHAFSPRTSAYGSRRMACSAGTSAPPIPTAQHETTATAPIWRTAPSGGHVNGT